MADGYAEPDVPNFQPGMSGEKVTEGDFIQFRSLVVNAQAAIDRLEEKQIAAHVALSEVNQLLLLAGQVLTLVERYLPTVGAAAGDTRNEVTKAQALLTTIQNGLVSATPLLATLGIKIPGLG